MDVARLPRTAARTRGLESDRKRGMECKMGWAGVEDKGWAGRDGQPHLALLRKGNKDRSAA